MYCVLILCQVNAPILYTRDTLDIGLNVCGSIFQGTCFGYCLTSSLSSEVPRTLREEKWSLNGGQYQTYQLYKRKIVPKDSTVIVICFS